MSLLEFTTTMDSSNSEEPPAKKYRYISERHPFRIFEDFDFDGLDDDDVGIVFAEISRISNFTAKSQSADANDVASASAKRRRHPAHTRKARRDERQYHHHQQQQANTTTVPQRVSVASMDDEDMATDDIQQHNDDVALHIKATNDGTASTTSTTSTTLPRNVSLHLFELATSAPTKHSNTKNAGEASLPSLAHSSASSVTHLYEMAEEDRMILEE